MLNLTHIKFVFFGTSKFSTDVLNALEVQGLTPSLIVATPDEPSGRGLEMRFTPTKSWALTHSIPIFQPETLKDQNVADRLREEGADTFLVASYGKMIPKDIYQIPPHDTLNIHPSLLPRGRGASPLQHTILAGDEPGVTLMKIVERMDAGPIIAQEKVSIPENPPRYELLEALLAKHGAKLFADNINGYIDGEITPREQDESEATYTKKIEKADALIDFSNSPEANLRKIRAYTPKPGAYFIFKRKDGKELRVIVRDAEIVGNEIHFLRVIPEGKKEMDWDDFLRGNG